VSFAADIEPEHQIDLNGCSDSENSNFNQVEGKMTVLIVAAAEMRKDVTENSTN
jgi:hypothetical protein